MVETQYGANHEANFGRAFLNRSRERREDFRYHMRNGFYFLKNNKSGTAG